jgi:hypothetical protein
MKDLYNSMHREDRDYTKNACKNFKEFINNKDTDKSYYREQMIKCIYDNKISLEKLMESENPFNELNKNETNNYFINYNSGLINNFRQSVGLKKICAANNKSTDIKDHTKIFRINKSVSASAVNNNNIDINIPINYSSQTKSFENGIICYKTKFNDFDIWYNDVYNVGTLCMFKKNTKLYNKNDLINIINKLEDDDNLLFVNNPETTESNNLDNANINSI